MKMRFTPEDEAARERARRDHATSFVLEAGAGTGKTTLLVDRILCLVREGHARLDQIAAVTFTENAATTMKLRLRERLENARADARHPPEERARCAAALDMLERAHLSTIHALCAAILQERPLECGVLPGFRMADEAETDLLFSEAWEEWLLERFTSGDDVLMDALEDQIPLESVGPWGERTSLRGLARTLLDQRDLAPIVAPDEGGPRGLSGRGGREGGPGRGARGGGARGRRAVRAAPGPHRVRGDAPRPHGPRAPRPPGPASQDPEEPGPQDPLVARGPAGGAGHRGLDRRVPGAARWPSAGCRLHGRLVTALGDVVRLYEAKKKARGVLDFLDLLTKARDALRDRPSVRRYFRDRFRYSDHRRVPGHRPRAGPGGGAARRGRAGAAGGGRRPQAVHLPLPARRGGALPEGLGGGRGRGPDARCCT